MNKLYDQLLYNWERGFYSVVKDKDDDYQVFSTKDSDGYFRGSDSWETKEEASRYIGEVCYSPEEIEADSDYYKWQIVDTIHPSELMGKGFQVGDKVIFEGHEWEYLGANGGKAIIMTRDQRYISSGSHAMTMNVVYKDLKPVLPIELEEKLVESSVNVDFDSGKPIARWGYLNGKYISIGERDVESRSHICNCGFWDSEKKWGETVYTQQFGDRCVSMSVTNNYVVCSTCGQKLRRVGISYLDD